MEARAIFVKCIKAVSTHKAAIKELEKAIVDTQALVDAERPQEEEARRQRMETEEAAAPNEMPPLFTAMSDVNGYNSRVLSPARIDQILMTDFLARKPGQQSKMLGLISEILKIDYEYKIVSKIHVNNGVGKPFKP